MRARPRIGVIAYYGLNGAILFFLLALPFAFRDHDWRPHGSSTAQVIIEVLLRG